MPVVLTIYKHVENFPGKIDWFSRIGFSRGFFLLRIFFGEWRIEVSTVLGGGVLAWSDFMGRVSAWGLRTPKVLLPRLLSGLCTPNHESFKNGDHQQLLSKKDREQKGAT